MQEGRYVGHLEPGMDVCDSDGNKVGSISRVYRHEMANVATGGETTAGTLPTDTETTAGTVPAGSETSVGTMPRDDILEVKTGVLGLGKHLYVPFSAIQDVTSGCVFVNVPKDRVDDAGWEVKPDYLEELS